MASRFNIRTLVIGSTIVAFGTSMPEFTVNINSAINGNTDLAFGNILGSDLLNICLLVGVVSFITPMWSASAAITSTSIISTITQLFLSDGLVFLSFFAIFMRYVYGESAVASTHHTKTVTSGVTGSGDGEKPHTTSSSLTVPPALARASGFRNGLSDWLSRGRARPFRN